MRIPVPNLWLATVACYLKDGLFGRPRSWKGSGTAIDLARHLEQDRTLKVEVINSRALTGTDWNPTPQDLLHWWEVMTQEDLSLESQKLQEASNGPEAKANSRSA